MDTEKDVVQVSRIMDSSSFFWQGDVKATEVWLEKEIQFVDQCRQTIAPVFLNEVFDRLMIPRIPGGYDFGWTESDPLKIGYQGREDETILIRITAVRIND